ncbi:uncharacterized protein LOC107272936 [Cephus cinctus]|uniref:Small RNA 2'-O-methyltransferase n=1 Tax=Cephus cinctus TaxID=211228 RepID=A0AAJ7CAP3_CEPCN|nr:uncharacterized protein LOC107272936 [Cephus cinctus]XP_015606109.1 uncharacterized protein LOC107272936 [Cephus cinctus]
MIIVLFHVLYLLGRIIYNTFQGKRATIIKEEISLDIVENSENDFDYKFYQCEIMGLKFYPPVYVQRYVAVQNVLSSERYSGKIRKVVDFGCAELAFSVYLKNTPGIQEILHVDIDKEILNTYKHRVEPLHADFLHTRSIPLTIRLYEGSVTHADRKLENCDAVICIELIEHLYPDTLMDFPYNVFGYIKPRVVVVTTPNADFNVLFDNFSGFRHPDHKFEWSREQFRDWAENIVARYPNYEVTIQGIGDGPAGTEHCGSCSQMAVFHRREEINQEWILGSEGLFKEVACYEYPFQMDNRSDEEKILDAATYYIRYLCGVEEEELALDKLMNSLVAFCITTELLREILVNAGWTIVDRPEGPVILVPARSVFSESAFDDDDFLDHERPRWGDEWNTDESSVPTEYYDNNAVPEENWDDDEMDQGDTFNVQYSGGFAEDELNRFSLNYYDHNDEGLDEFDQELVIEKTYDDPQRTQEGNHFDPYMEMEHDNHEVQDFVPVDFHSISEEQELPSNSVTIGLDQIDLDDLDISNSSLQSEPIVMTSMPFSSYGENYFSGEESRVSFYLKTEPTDDPFYKQKSEDAFQRNRGLSEEVFNGGTTYSLDKMNLHDDRMTSQPQRPLQLTTSSGLKLLFPPILLKSKSIDNSVPSISNEIHIENGIEQLPIRNGESIEYSCISNAHLKHEANPMQSLSLNSITSDISGQPQFTSSPRVLLESEDKKPMKSTTALLEEQLCEREQAQLSSSRTTMESSSNENLLENSSQTSLLGLSNTSESSSLIMEKWYQNERIPMYQQECVTLKGGNDFSDKPEETTSDSDVPEDTFAGMCESKEADSRCKTIITQKCELDEHSSQDGNNTLLNNINDFSKDSKCIFIPEEDAKSENNQSNCQTCSKNVLIADTVSTKESKIPCASQRPASKQEIAEVKPISPEALETPPNSFSPEIMDSGYPNSASALDITPENDLSSIAHDRISDSESPSVAEAPRPGFLELVEVENGDLANNNRDGEGNNMIAVGINDVEDLQPLIDVLENDLENENDIYVLENGFPLWLLRILEMANPVDVEGGLNYQHPPDEPAGGDAPDLNLDHDEGFDSSSSEEDSVVEDDEDDDDDDDVDDATTPSSDNTEDDNPGNLPRDWGAGGDP